MHIYNRNVEKHTTLNKTHRNTTVEPTNKTLLQIFPATNQRACIIPEVKPKKMARNIQIISVYK